MLDLEGLSDGCFECLKVGDSLGISDDGAVEGDVDGGRGTRADGVLGEDIEGPYEGFFERFDDGPLLGMVLKLLIEGELDGEKEGPIV